jgi:hypothetical protein
MGVGVGGFDGALGVLSPPQALAAITPITAPVSAMDVRHVHALIATSAVEYSSEVAVVPGVRERRHRL